MIRWPEDVHRRAYARLRRILSRPLCLQLRFSRLLPRCDALRCDAAPRHPHVQLNDPVVQMACLVMLFDVQVVVHDPYQVVSMAAQETGAAQACSEYTVPARGPMP